MNCHHCGVEICLGPGGDWVHRNGLRSCRGAFDDHRVAEPQQVLCIHCNLPIAMGNFSYSIHLGTSSRYCILPSGSFCAEPSPGYRLYTTQELRVPLPRVLQAGEHFTSMLTHSTYPIGSGPNLVDPWSENQIPRTLVYNSVDPTRTLVLTAIARYSVDVPEKEDECREFIETLAKTPMYRDCEYEYVSIREKYQSPQKSSVRRIKASNLDKQD